MSDYNVNHNGKKVETEGNTLHVGDTAPDFTLINVDMRPVSLKDFKGKTVILSVVPSLDTPTCTLQTRRFNKEAEALKGKDIEIITVSKDLPFAQARWREMAGADTLKTLSDYRNTSFAHDYGLLMKDTYLLARSVFIINKEGKIDYIQIVPEMSHEPKYDEVITEAKKIAGLTN
ncbi:thiol peroxidase [Parelusimicrobium proximum]|uniref:thiol peroxidase n=1 Tax=Parelusimicrobium proximum TaxID=3228953 RepID=UPI003D17187E